MMCLMKITAENLNLEEGSRVLIAYHLYKQCFSVRLRKTHKVVGYMNTIILTDSIFNVHASGRIRVLKEKRKNFHAYVEGNLSNISNLPPRSKMREAYYNPYMVENFVDRETLEIITYADIVLCDDGKVYYYLNKTL